MPDSPTRLAAALAAIPGCPQEMIAVARAGYYDDAPGTSPLSAPRVQLVTDLLTLADGGLLPPLSRRQLRDLAKAAIDGAFSGRATCQS